jgi:hypothetical protein
MDHRILLGVLACSGLMLYGCGSDGSGARTGQLNLKIGDAPVDGASEVVVVFTGVELHSNGTTTSIDFDAPLELDLLAYQNGATFNLLENETVPAGEYQWMRLKVIAEPNQNDGSYILFESGSQYPLYIPSGAESGLKINRPFRVAQGGITRLVADFDLRKSILAPPGQDPNYVLKPVLRLVDELEVGGIDGEVDLAALALQQLGEGTVAADCAGGIYLFSGSAVSPDDTDGDDVDGSDPIAYQPLAFDGLENVVPYSFAFVEAGTYTLAATCDFDVDASPEASEYDSGAASGEPGFETMHWNTADDVVVAADQTTTVNLP